jgi:hypothetical protein
MEDTVMDEDAVKCAGCVIALVPWFLIGLLIGWGIEWAWNLIVAGVFHGPTINFAEGCAFYLLISVIGSAFRGRSS